MKNIILLFLLIPAISKAQDSTAIHQLIDNWHKAAAVADADTFFGFMADDAIYIGTDKTERWDKNSFFGFAKPYFDRGKAWAFTPYNRQLIFSEDKTTAWFSELLETWMGDCRGSGILTLKEGEWKLRQYHLSVTVPNGIIEDFIHLVNAYEGKN